MNYLGIDWGQSKIGFALGTSEMKISSPILILSYKNLSELAKSIQKLIDDEKIDELIIGQPKTLAGEENLHKNFEEFLNWIKQFGKLVHLEDERMSTKYAESMKKEFKGYKKVGDDDIAAAAILQSYFERL
ncbi:hypothetical protein A2533_02085 [Candidatus Falkowbacteria bacterium RIFOXYD2_FULL_35_9]|uniref:Putative pre-16S rRNA nuclease n=1 Tax=Candidatus Falkowbacteria bacterium RIFOXYC2_FULL_36_12 TaxID=1798002 RepID=A0A1F5SWX9_9BACT|nr:MAG: hypothetical protein A2300_04590 [Candidatus Falkowbacteria bacterium RIFOXYB2_FULL_35_7]OGF30963.1 MAG: hypothetical protein A2478_00775 [Candidatus Falkowbacteria bacterium RIFOXYC2_FULL_36_12]OGF34391.1 MAG: hypothetical protein A2223_02575 [Candidatus Falkowbacteria bacterium RIFOXYA2_FULL_35_8]OGF47287.1 MAG: hypothetical protein A2533_02085 [Candidatus Falkowbacteria bacterium RIFOXYD2_FULL_35_9]